MTRRTSTLLRELGALREIVAVYRRLRPDLLHHVAIKPVVYGSIAAAFRLLLRRGQVIVQNPDDLQAVRGFGIAREAISMIRGAGVELDRFVPRPEQDSEPIDLLASRMLWSRGIKEFTEASGLVKERGVQARFVSVGEPDAHNPDAVSEETLAR